MSVSAKVSVSSNRGVVVVGLWLILTATLASGCGSRSETDHRIAVVASTDVYGDIAEQIGGPDVRVSSLIDSPNQDPHAFQADAHDALAVSKADVLIQNGGGYDDFVGTLRDSAGRAATQVIDVVRLSGHITVDGRLNEHVWYDLGTVRRFVTRVVQKLTSADPSHRASFRRNATVFTGRLAALQRTEAHLAAHYTGTGVAVTEPVPLYLLEACGLANRTPTGFTDAVEEDTDVPASVLHRTLGLFSAHSVHLLVYNEQSGGPQTDEVIAGAKQAGVPVVGVTETLPPGTTYLNWMATNLAAVSSALKTGARS